MSENLAQKLNAYREKKLTEAAQLYNHIESVLSEKLIETVDKNMSAIYDGQRRWNPYIYVRDLYDMLNIEKNTTSDSQLVKFLKEHQLIHKDSKDYLMDNQYFNIAIFDELLAARKTENLDPTKLSYKIALMQLNHPAFKNELLRRIESSFKKELQVNPQTAPIKLNLYINTLVALLTNYPEFFNIVKEIIKNEGLSCKLINLELIVTLPK